METNLIVISSIFVLDFRSFRNCIQFQIDNSEIILLLVCIFNKILLDCQINLIKSRATK